MFLSLKAKWILLYLVKNAQNLTCGRLEKKSWLIYQNNQTSNSLGFLQILNAYC